MRADFETLKLEWQERHLLLVTLNRPEAANAFNTQMARDLLDLWLGLVLDPEGARCVVLTGAGEKAFCAGGDLKERNGMTDEQWRRQHVLFEQAFYRMLDVEVPIVGAINGAAFGGGCEMTLACDFAYAAKRAVFALTEVSLGIMPGAGGTQNLPRAIGPRRAKEMILSAMRVPAGQALEWGIVNRVCENESLMSEVLETARRICANGPISVRQAKKSIDVAHQVDLKNGLAFEVEAYNRMLPTEDRLEGVRAFNEKRKPNFQDR